MKLKLACADFTFPLLPHDKVLKLIAMLEFEAVDVGLFEGRSHLRPSKVLKAPEKHGGQLGRELAGQGLCCADVFLQPHPDFSAYAINHPDVARRRQARDWFVRTLDYASACGATHVTALPGVYFSDERPAASWQRCCEELAWRIEQANQYRIIFGVEAHADSIVPNPKAALRLIHGVPGLTLTLDYTHFTSAGIPDWRVEPLIAHASHFHARGASRKRLQAALPQNVIDYAGVLRAMRRTGYRGYVGVEYLWIDWQRCNEVDNISETILLRNLLRAIVRGL